MGIETHKHLEAIADLARSIDEDMLDTPFSIPSQIDKLRKQNEWLHELQEHTLACIEENHLTIDALRRLQGLRDGE